jgi:general secretion pathway protein K
MIINAKHKSALGTPRLFRPHTHHASRITPQSGIALIIVMISILVLAVLAGGFAYSMKVETALAHNANSETELQWIGRSGVEYARWILAQQMACTTEPFDALTQVWAGGSGGPCTTNSALADVQREVHIGHGSFTWKISDLERKWNINTLVDQQSGGSGGGEGILQAALMVIGVDSGEFPSIIGAILDWIDTNDQPSLEGAESDYYRTLNPPYDAKNGPIDDISELLLVRGITDHPEIYWGSSSTNHPQSAVQFTRGGVPVMPPFYPVGLVDLFTPISSGKININTASASVLQLIPGVDAKTAEAIVGGRQGEDDGSGLTGPYPNLNLLSRVLPQNELAFIMPRIQTFCDVRSRTFEVEIEAQVGGYKRHFSAILARNSPRDVQILTFSWK